IRDFHVTGVQTCALPICMNEFEVQALIEYTFRRYGGRPGYASIVGSGPNSTVLHYNRDDRFMQAGELLLIDAAASYGGYTADIKIGRASCRERAAIRGSA